MTTTHRASRKAVTVDEQLLAERCAHGRIVLIDDDPHVREALAGLLRFEGYACECYSDAEAYLRNRDAPQFPGPVCVLTDVSMPGLTGLALQKALAGEDIPVLVMSGESGAAEAVSAFRQGAVDFLLKPIEADALFDGVERALQRHRAHSQASAQAQGIATLVGALTTRERQVAELVATGLPNRLIGLRLQIAERTVKHHRQQAMEKLGATSAVELARVLDAAAGARQGVGGSAA